MSLEINWEKLIENNEKNENYNHRLINYIGRLVEN